MNKGMVYLVGAGPGDPKLITLRGLEAIERADVVVYDRLASPRLLRYMKRDAQKIFVGKKPDHHAMRQEDICQLLVDLALEGKIVTRLKGGDPCVFGRVGEEAQALSEQQIAFEIVPGITSAIAVPAYAGIPVTHRDFASSFTVVTGHEKHDKTQSSTNWEQLAQSSGTLIFLMGVANLQSICACLIDGGKPAGTPIALIRWGTCMDQQTLVGTLADITKRVRAAQFTSPAIIIVGEVVRLREQLAWFEHKPLFGRRILVTRAQAQASELAAAISELGGEPIEFPVIRTQPPSQEERVADRDEALRQAAQFDWIVFTSANGVHYFFDRLCELGIDIRRLVEVQLAAVGSKTAAALRERGLLGAVVPQRYDAEGLLADLSSVCKPGQRVLLPVAQNAGNTLELGLAALGVQVKRVTLYETVPEAEDGAAIAQMLRAGQIDTVTFTSSSTVLYLLSALHEAAEEQPTELLNRSTRHVCIGPRTAATASEAGLSVAGMPEEATVAAMLETLVKLGK